MLAMLLIALAGCSSTYPTMDIDSAIPAVRTFERDQLVFHADFLLPRRHRLVDEIVRRREEVGTMLDIDVSTQPVHVYLFKDEDRFREFVYRTYPELPERRAFFVNNLGRLNVYAWWSDKVGTDLRHEITHGYLHGSVNGIPLWMDEGIAEYFEVADGHGGINRPHIELLTARLDEGSWQPDLHRLEQIIDPARMTQVDYAESWLWIHFLLNDNPQARTVLRQRFDELEQGLPMTPVSTVVESSIAGVDESLLSYLKGLAGYRPAAQHASR